YLRHVAGTHSTRALTDAQLLRRFAADREETAFAALMQRHGRLVWGVCRHVLRREQDAEDAFQATFLVLARRASSILKGDSAAGELGWKEGTVSGRIAQARRLLQQRLARRGVALSAALCAGAVAGGTASAAVAPALAGATARAAARVAAGQAGGAAPAHVLAL